MVKRHYIRTKATEEFEKHLRDDEKSPATIEKYMRDVGVFMVFCKGQAVTKELVLAYKSQLVNGGRYAVGSINSMLSSVNCFLRFMGWDECRVKAIRTQRRIYCAPEKELTQREYERLLKAARCIGDERLELLVQTIGATGIRVSEVQAITVESLRKKQAEIRCKGKIRIILLPKKLCETLLGYCKRRGIQKGQVFVTRTGRPLDRSNIWKMMKRLGERAQVRAGKVFPHNLRHLFARTYYKAYKDIVRLADILGHACIDTTRIYTMRTGTEQQRQIERLPLLV